jgi:glyceraldehyde 3-phosphate dehydrogenase
MPLRVGLNGAGRIGRALLRLLAGDPRVEIAAINDVAGAEAIAHLLRHDSVYGAPPFEVEAAGAALRVADRTIPFTAFPHPEEVPWPDHGATAVVEATGRFSRAPEARRHLAGTVRQVLVTAVCPGADATVIPGLPGFEEGTRAPLVSTASCTTQAAALPLALLDRWFGVVAAEMTTVHCTTGSQVTMDQPHADPRRARSSLLSMIPTTTSAGTGLGLALPHLAGRVSCLAIRVPTASVSLIELVAETERPAGSRDELAARFRAAAAEAPLAGRLGVTDEPLVSVDFKGDPRASVVDLPLLEVPGTRLVRVVAWYDNEWGYANRVADVLRVWGESRDGRGPARPVAWRP